MPAVGLLGLGATAGWTHSAERLLVVLFAYPWTLSIGLFLPVALLLFPDGRPAGTRWRWLVRAAIAEGLLFVLCLGQPKPVVIGHRAWTAHLPYHVSGALLVAANIGWAGILAGAITALAVRYRRGGDVERRQLLWLLLAGLGVLAYGGVAWGIFVSGPILGLLVIPLIPVAVSVAILRYQLLDIRLVVSRALLYILLTAGVAGAYVGLVALIDAMVSSKVSLGSAVAASVVIAIAFNPVAVAAARAG